MGTSYVTTRTSSKMGKKGHDSVMSIADATSRTSQLHLSQDSSRTRGSRVFALLIGIDEYQYGIGLDGSTENDAPYIRAPNLATSPITVASTGSNRIRNLRGATADAEEMKKFLVQNLKVPDGQAGDQADDLRHIKLLLNEDATRDNIISAFEDLAKDDRIKKGDPIIIYYAGHGATADRPSSWGSMPHEFQVLVPYDAKTMDGDLEGIITDYKIRSLLGNLSKEKGDNITVIFDCCHSAGLNRGGQQQDSDDDELIRGLDFGGRIKLHDQHRDEILASLRDQDVDEDKEGYRGLPQKIFHADHGSHILLAACGEEEEAREIAGKGLFTRKLLRALKSPGSYSYTYNDVISKVGSLAGGRQSPRCVGKYKNRRLFNDCAKIVIPPLHFSVRERHQGGRRDFEIAGDSDSDFLDVVLASRKLAVYASIADAALAGDRLCTLDIKPSRRQPPCIAELANKSLFSENRLPDTAIAVPILDDLPIFVSNEAKFPSVYEAISICRHYLDRGICNIKLVDCEEKAKLGIKLQDSSIIVSIIDKAICSLAASAQDDLPIGNISVATMKPSSFVPVFRKATYFFHRLRHAPVALEAEESLSTIAVESTESEDLIRGALQESREGSKAARTRLSDFVGMAIFEIEIDIGGDDTDFRPVPNAKHNVAIGEQKRSGPFEPWVVNVGDSDDPVRYGVRLHSVTKRTIFPYMVYFDCNTLEIRTMYSPPSAPQGTKPGSGNGTLGRQKPLALNYGDGDGEQLELVLPEESETEAGFLRIFLTTALADLSIIDQEGLPADKDGESGESKLDEEAEYGYRGVPARAKQDKKLDVLWDVITLPIRLVRA